MCEPGGTGSSRISSSKWESCKLISEEVRVSSALEASDSVSSPGGSESESESWRSSGTSESDAVSGVQGPEMVKESPEKLLSNAGCSANCCGGTSGGGGMVTN